MEIVIGYAPWTYRLSTLIAYNAREIPDRVPELIDSLCICDGPSVQAPVVAFLEIGAVLTIDKYPKVVHGSIADVIFRRRPVQWRAHLGRIKSFGMVQSQRSK